MSSAAKLSETDLLLRLASWQHDSLVDGPGFRFTVFAQGCPHRCPGCHNPETHLPLGGLLISVAEVLELYRQSPLARGITLSGGEPFSQAEAMAELAAMVHSEGGDVVTYTGYVYERLQKMALTDASVKRLLRQTDLLVDGPFVLSQSSLNLPFRGSRNQRLLALSDKGKELLQTIPL